HWPSPGILYGSYSCNEGSWNGDHFVTGADAGREQGQVQRAGAAIDCDREFRSGEGREFLFKGRNLFAQHKLARLKHFFDRWKNLVFERQILLPEVDKRNVHGKMDGQASAICNCAFG